MDFCVYGKIEYHGDGSVDIGGCSLHGDQEPKRERKKEGLGPNIVFKVTPS
jgi:hypothetical protein